MSLYVSVCLSVSLLGADVSHVYVCGWTCEYLSSAFRKALAASVDSYPEIKNASPFLAKFGGIKVPESDAWSLMDRFP